VVVVGAFVVELVERDPLTLADEHPLSRSEVPEIASKTILPGRRHQSATVMNKT